MVPVLELLPAEMQISSLLGKQLSSCLLRQRTDFIHLCSVIQLAMLRVGVTRVAQRGSGLVTLGGEVPARTL